MYQANLNLGVLQETNLMDIVYNHRSVRYSIVAMYALIQHRGGVAVFYCEYPWFAAEAIQ